MRTKAILAAILLTMFVASSVILLRPVRAEEDDVSFNYNYADISGQCQVYDPFESFNRKIFFVNGVLDYIITRPIAKLYGATTNDYVKARVGSFVGNVEEPLSTVNYALQGKGEGVYKSFWRFVINSTIGIGGLFDVAGKFDVNAEQQRFSNTLGHYGVGPGPYIVLPIFGGSGFREVGDSIVTNRYMNPLKYALHSDFRLGVTIGKIIHNRDEIMPFTDYVSENSPDPYIAIRDAIMQQRESKIDYPDNFKCPVIK